MTVLTRYFSFGFMLIVLGMIFTNKMINMVHIQFKCMLLALVNVSD